MSSYVTAELPREKLKELIQKNGEGLLNDPDRTEALLRDHCGAHRKEISALVGALEERVPLELKSSWQSAMTPEAMRARLVQRLEENRGLSTGVATWAVDAWSYALGVGLERRSDPVADLPVADAAGVAALAGAENGPGTPSKSVAERIASDRAGAEVAPIDNRKNGSIAQVFNTPKKAGIGAVVALGLVAAAFGLFRQPPPPPQPPNNNDNQHGTQQNGQNKGGGSQNGGTQQNGSQGNNGSQGGNGGTNSQGDSGSGTASNGSNNSTHGGTSGSGTTHITPVPALLQIPAGTAIPVRLDRPLNSEDLNQGDLVAATVSSPVTVNGDVVIRTGARAHLRVAGVDHTAETDGSQHLRLVLADVETTQGRVLVASRTHDFAGPKRSQDEVKRGVVGGAVGAIGGAVIGHLFHHAGAGAAAGGGGGAVTGVATSKAGPVKLEAETAMNSNCRVLSRRRGMLQTAQ